MPRVTSSHIMPEWVTDALREAPPILTKREVSTLVRLSGRQISRLMASGKLIPLRTTDAGSSRVLFARGEVARFLESIERAA